MQDVEKISGDNLAILRSLLFIEIALQRHDQFITILLDHKSNQLLPKCSAKER